MLKRHRSIGFFLFYREFWDRQILKSQTRGPRSTPPWSSSPISPADATRVGQSPVGINERLIHMIHEGIGKKGLWIWGFVAEIHEPLYYIYIYKILNYP